MEEKYKSILLFSVNLSRLETRQFPVNSFGINQGNLRV